MGGNNALGVNTNTQNGKHVDIAITTRGSDWYYAVCALMGFTTLAIIAAAHRPNFLRSHRLFYYITAGINFVAFIAYFSMGSNLGWTPIDVEFMRSNPRVSGINREIFYVRYIDWAITTPLLILDLMLSAGAPWQLTVWTILLDEVMIVTGLIGALVRTRYKWGFYAIGCAAMLYVFYNIIVEGRRCAGNSDIRASNLRISRTSPPFSTTHLHCAVWTIALWLLYPIAWGVCEGGNVISPDGEAIFYGILDILAKPGFSILLLASHRKLNPAEHKILGAQIRNFDEEPKIGSSTQELFQPDINGLNHTTNNGINHTTGNASTLNDVYATTSPAAGGYANGMPTSRV